MTAFAALTGPMPKLGVVVIALLAAGALLLATQRARAAAALGALVLAPVLLLADIWHSQQLGFVHRHPLPSAVGALVALAAVSGVALAIFRRPGLLAPLTVLALPFRVPIATGGTTSSLLVPLYLVVAAGSLAVIVPALAGGRSANRQAAAGAGSGRGWVERLLALYIVVYALQAVYSPGAGATGASGFEKALQQMVFFYVPFTLLFCLLRRMEWTPRLGRICLQLVAALAVVFALVGFAEYETKTLFLNPKLIAANDLHAYFTVNSVFFDPDIFGRFLALVMTVLAAVLLYGRDWPRQIGATAILAVLWGGLVLTLSRSSLAALLIGLGTLAALRWRAGRVLLAGAAVVAIGAAAVAISPTTFGLNQGLNGASSGRANLVTGGIDLFSERPLWGYGSGSFVREYQAHHPGSSQTLSASHTIPITVAAEQGLIGEAVYIALVLVAAVALIRGAGADPARAAIAAAFLALVFHTMLYADYLEDPVTWTLLGIGGALAAGGAVRSERAPAPVGDAAPVPA